MGEVPCFDPGCVCCRIHTERCRVLEEELDELNLTAAGLADRADALHTSLAEAEAQVGRLKAMREDDFKKWQRQQATKMEVADDLEEFANTLGTLSRIGKLGIDLNVVWSAIARLRPKGRKKDAD